MLEDLSESGESGQQVCGYQPQNAHRLHQKHLHDIQDQIAVEVPVALVYNGLAHAVMMASPTDLQDFAYGFSFTEGIIERVEEIYDCEWNESAQGYSIEITIASERFVHLKQKKRSLTGRTGCGLCGVESLLQAIHPPPTIASNARFQTAAVTAAVEAMRERQVLLQITGSTHAAAWCLHHGDIELLREDVGRHNALDKIIGAALRAGKTPDQSFITITSRASYEMIQKTARIGIPLLAAVSGVTSLAVEMAMQSELGLIGFTRGSDFSVYSHPHRLILEES